MHVYSFWFFLFHADIESRPRHWPLARWPDRFFHLLWPVGLSRASGSSSPLARKGQWPSLRQFGPQGVCSALARNLNQIWESNLRRCANQIWVVASICFLWFGRLRSSPGFPVSVTHPRIRANSSDYTLRFPIAESVWPRPDHGKPLLRKFPWMTQCARAQVLPSS